MNKQLPIKVNAILNIFKQVLNVAFPLITFPYVSRVLLDENYGKYSFSITIINYFMLLASLGIATYAVREGAKIRDNYSVFQKFASQIFSINIITTLISLFLLAAITIFWPKLNSYWCLILVQSFQILATTIGADWVNTIYEDFLYITIRYIVCQLLGLAAIFLFVRKVDDYVIYAGIMTATVVFANLFNVWYIRRYVSLHFTCHMSIAKHLPPSLFLFANALAISIYVNIGTTLLGIFRDDSTVGVYSFAVKVYGIAKNILNAIVVVAIPRLSLLSESDPTKFKQMVTQILSAILLLMIPMICGIIVLSPDLSLLLGGEAFVRSSGVLQILGMAIVPAVISCLISNGVLIIYGKEKLCLISTAVAAVVNLVSNLCFTPFWGSYGAAVSTVVAELLACILSCFFAAKYYLLSIKSAIVVPIIIECCIIVLLAILLDFWFNSLLKVVMCVCISCFLYFFVILLSGNKNFFILNKKC